MQCDTMLFERCTNKCSSKAWSYFIFIFIWFNWTGSQTHIHQCKYWSRHCQNPLWSKECVKMIMLSWCAYSCFLSLLGSALPKITSSLQGWTLESCPIGSLIADHETAFQSLCYWSQIIVINQSTHHGSIPGNVWSGIKLHSAVENEWFQAFSVHCKL